MKQSGSGKRSDGHGTKALDCLSIFELVFLQGKVFSSSNVSSEDVLLPISRESWKKKHLCPPPVGRLKRQSCRDMRKNEKRSCSLAEPCLFWDHFGQAGFCSEQAFFELFRKRPCSLDSLGKAGWFHFLPTQVFLFVWPSLGIVWGVIYTPNLTTM